MVTLAVCVLDAACAVEPAAHVAACVKYSWSLVLAVRPGMVVTAICCGVPAAVETIAAGATEQTVAHGARHGFVEPAITLHGRALVLVQPTSDRHAVSQHLPSALPPGQTT